MRTISEVIDDLCERFNIDEEFRTKIPDDITPTELYEVAVLLQERGDEDALIALTNKQLAYDGSAYSKVRAAQQEEDDFIGKPPEVEEGVLECFQCGSKKTVSYTLQVAAGDESTSVWAACVKCGNKWKS